MNSRLVRFLVTIFVLLGGLELFVRANGSYFNALSDKILLNIKILEREPETKVLFLGTSRFLDAIDHHLFTKELEKRTGREYKSFNAATAGLQSEGLVYFAKIAAQNEGLTHVIIEASPPAMAKGTLDLPGQAPKVVQAVEEERFADRIENRLQSFFVDKVAMFTYRKALRPKTMIKLLVLYTANVMDSNIWSRKRPLEAIFLPAHVEVGESFIERFQPDIVTPNSEVVAPPPQEQFTNLEKISEVFSNSDIKVIWVVPPVSKQQVKGNHNAKYTGYYRAIANQGGQVFYDYGGIGIEGQYLRDLSHLNGKGRNAFTKILAAHLTSHFSSDKSAP